ncbi:MAG: hypothetical protein ACEPOW_05560, partial [Bacteroidales bacterium]
MLKWLQYNAQLIYKVFLFVVALIIILIILPKERKFEYEFSLGKPWLHEDLIAPFDFPILKDNNQLEEEKKQILNHHHPYFKYDEEQETQSFLNYRKVFDEEWRGNRKTDPKTDPKAIENYKLGFSILDTLMSHGIIEMHESLEKRDSTFFINVIEANTSRNLPFNHFFSIHSADEYIKEKLSENSSLDTSLLRLVLEDVMLQNVIFDEKTNNNVLKNALLDISNAHGLIQKGEKIISRGELVSSEKYRELTSLKKDYEGQINVSTVFYQVVGGQAILVVVSLLILFMMLKFFDKSVFQQNKLIVLILLLIVLELLMFSLIMKLRPSALLVIPKQLTV